MGNLFRNIQIPIELNHDKLVDLQQKLQMQASILFKEYDSFEKDTLKLLDTVDELIKRPYTPDPNILKAELTDLTAISASVGQYLADANSFLNIFVTLFYTPKQQNYSEADRKLNTDLRTLIQENLLNKLKNASDRLDKRITVYQSLLKHATAELSRMGD
jgi:hypothetical protein